MAPDQRSDHELLLQILDKMIPIEVFVKASNAVLWGKQDDNESIGLVARVNKSQDDIIDHEKRLKAIESLVPWIKLIIGIGSAAGLAIISLVIALITGEVVLVFP